MTPASNPQRVQPGDSGWAALVRRVVDDATRADRHAPLNEEALLGLANHGLSGAELYVEPEGFALVRDGNLDLVVAPAARGQGRGRVLLEATSLHARSPRPTGSRPSASSG